MDPGRLPPEPSAPGGHLMHELIGQSLHDFSETVRHSISPLARKDPDTDVTAALAVAGPGTEKPDINHNDEDEDDNNIPHPPRPPQPPKRRPLHLLTLPPEILIMILQHLNFPAILRVSTTCKQLHHLASPAQISTLVGADWLDAQLQRHCKRCLVHDPWRSIFLTPQPQPRPRDCDPSSSVCKYALASLCLGCAIKVRDPRIRVGRRVPMAKADVVLVCRWCGFPVVLGFRSHHIVISQRDQMHRLCYRRYHHALFVFRFVLGGLQFGLGIVAAALAWRYFRHRVLVFAPTVTNFLLMWICLAFLHLRDTSRRTYHYTLLLELAILALWIPPVYYVAGDIISHKSGGPVPRATQATLAMFALNMYFRLVNLAGNIVLLFRFDSTMWTRLGLPRWRRPFHYLATALVMWTYPQSLEAKLAGDSV
ncbi:uncharacterized protein B0T15DRAFT_485713 [Chaetomium strumarium]|uniref:F-box domain-containing protein n=1 Tax=Chaetomium strumarium TaxID=1170767 RepID=A0AAJ0GPR9_9PEZI|nr:hypothetical protein B0T15DRAFT_485713 [Chaetomium strumarium]